MSFRGLSRVALAVAKDLHELGVHLTSTELFSFALPSSRNNVT
jgi:hypothetical protein